MRMLDQLDEQLHAGSALYFIIGNNRIISFNTIGFWMGVFVTGGLGFCLVPFFDNLGKTKHLIYNTFLTMT